MPAGQHAPRGSASRPDSVHGGTVKGMVTANQLTAARQRSASFLTAKITIRRINPDDVTFVDGHLVTAEGEVIYCGDASIADAGAREQVTKVIGGDAVQEATWLIRAPLTANAVQPGDEIVIDDPGDYPLAHRHLWAHAVKGRQAAVLARIIATATRPGDVT